MVLLYIRLAILGFSVLERLIYVWRDELLDVRPVVADLFDQARTGVAVGVLGHDEDGFDIRVEVAIHQGHLELELEIGQGPQAPDKGAGAEFLCQVDGQPAKLGRGHVAKRLEIATNQFHPLVRSEEGAYARILGHRDHDLIE